MVILYSDVLAGALDTLAYYSGDGLIEHVVHIGGLLGARLGEPHLNITKYTPLVLANFSAYCALTWRDYFMSSLFPTRYMMILVASELSSILSSQSWILTKVSASVMS